MKLLKNKFFKSIFLSSLIFSIINTTLPVYAHGINETICSIPVNEQTLVFDNEIEDTLPKRFRMTTMNILDASNLNLTGLKTLNISGSQQYSAKSLNLMKNKLPKNMNLVFFDLRQESHGFINGLPISWDANGDKANEGLSKEQVILQNAQQLASIKIGTPISIKNKSITPTSVYSEEELIKNNKNTYIRVTVTDTKLPSPEMVDFFVSSINSLPKNSWLHFHCKEGIGRTTTFMIMYDMMKNAKTVPLNDIIARQLKLANLTSKEESFESGDRFAFLQSFYNYCKQGNFKQPFSQFNPNYKGNS